MYLYSTVQTQGNALQREEKRRKKIMQDINVLKKHSKLIHFILVCYDSGSDIGDLFLVTREFHMFCKVCLKCNVVGDHLVPSENFLNLS